MVETGKLHQNSIHHLTQQRHPLGAQKSTTGFDRLEPGDGKKILDIIHGEPALGRLGTALTEAFG